MTNAMEAFEVRIGEHVALANDDWTLLGRDIVLVEAEPVSGSTQCVVRDGTEMRVVARNALRCLS